MREAYIAELEALPLPVDEPDLDVVHESALVAALDRFDRASFGASSSAEMQALGCLHADADNARAACTSWWSSLNLPCGSCKCRHGLIGVNRVQGVSVRMWAPAVSCPWSIANVSSHVHPVHGPGPA